jgi:hypothetical protein
MRHLMIASLSLLALLSKQTLSFYTPSIVVRRNGQRLLSGKAPRQSAGSLGLFNIFGSLDDFFNNPFNKSKSNVEASDANGAAGTFRLVQLPVSSIKPGGLRLFLMFYLLGMQNTPDKNSWKAHQPSTEEYVVDFWFHDNSAVLSVELNQNYVTIDRVGSTPSTQYLMQEAVIVNGMLDELRQCATDQSVSRNDRLLVLEEDDAIEKARESLSFG